MSEVIKLTPDPGTFWVLSPEFSKLMIGPSPTPPAYDLRIERHGRPEIRDTISAPPRFEGGFCVYRASDGTVVAVPASDVALVNVTEIPK